MNCHICSKKCNVSPIPKFIARYSDTGNWYVLFDSLTMSQNWRCNAIQIEPMGDFLETNKEKISKNWRKVTDKLRECNKVSDYWKFIGGDFSYVLSNAHIVCNGECNCQWLVEQTMYDIRHSQRKLKIRENETVPLPNELL